ncbi:MAG: phosphonate ABC transporter, permease protein PhnE [Trueperaceae bacterium]|nr:phosphonate ABC transporter, permease protein PhnE [Trueperaceae bacterium]
MPLIERGGAVTWTPTTPRQRLLSAIGTVLLLGITAFAWVVVTQDTRWEFVADAFYQGRRLLARMFPPDFAYAGKLLGPLVDTINIATLGTLAATALAVPVALGAARNTTPHPLIRALCLLIIVASRSVHSLIWALVLVFVFGPGLFAGVVALSLRSIGFIGKLLYEAVEEVDKDAVEAIESTGATRLQRIVYAIQPQTLPQFAGTVLFRWDINIRESTFLGLVGAGGIGMLLDASVNALQFSRVSVILLTILLLVLVTEWASMTLRARIR